MLTRLTIQGFKNLLDVDLCLGPFTCLVGENAVGKSNLFSVREADYGGEGAEGSGFVRAVLEGRQLHEADGEIVLVTMPRMLINTSTKDDRVHPGHARKMAARMIELGHAPLYWENIEGGHGGAADNEQRATWQAIEYAYLWMQLGGK